MVIVLRKHCDEGELFKDGGWVSASLGRHVVSCWPKGERMYMGVGICGSAGWCREVTMG